MTKGSAKREVRTVSRDTKFKWAAYVTLFGDYLQYPGEIEDCSHQVQKNY